MSQHLGKTYRTMGWYVQEINLGLDGWLFGSYGISTFIGYLTPSPFLFR